MNQEMMKAHANHLATPSTRRSNAHGGQGAFMSKINPAIRTESSPDHEARLLHSHFDYYRECIEGRQRALEEFLAVVEGTVGNKYRFRAECHRDASLFLHAILAFIHPSWTMEPIERYPDVEVGFTLDKPISARDLLWIASCITDCHVIVQTLEREERYTGNRDYYREIDIHDPTLRPQPYVLAEMKRTSAAHISHLKHVLSDAKQFVADLRVIAGCL